MLPEVPRSMSPSQQRPKLPNLRRAQVSITLGGLFLTAAFLSAAVLPNRQTDVVETAKGTLRITPLYHGSVLLEFNGKIIYVVPWSQADFTGLPQADMIVISHTHADHMDPAQ